jgi:hypothetical protein
MKMKLILLVFITSQVFVHTQNLQLHYDFGKDRKYFTSTFELFKVDEYGATFSFIDFDHNDYGNKTISLAYFEIARYFKISFLGDLQPTIQYNDGYSNFGRLGNVFLIGAMYPVDLGIFKINSELLYRKDYLSDGNDIQATLSWYKPFLNDFLVFSGFLDLWTAKKPETDRKIVLLTEPQIWLNIWKRLSVGSELEISSNFIPGEKDVLFNPTLAIKWNFE